MAKQRTDYKNRDNSKTNIRQYVDVYIRILTRHNCIVPAASTQPRADGATEVQRLYEQPALESAFQWSSTQLQIQSCMRRMK
jgi:hypothetical protein